MIKNQRKIGVLLSYVTMLSNSVIGIVFTPFMTGTLGKAEYGLYQLVASFSAYLMLVDFGTATTVSRYLSKYRTEEDRDSEENFLAMMVMQTAALSAIAIIAGTVIYFFLDNIFAASLTAVEIAKAKKMFVMMIANVAITLFSHVWRGINTADERFVYNNASKLVRILLRIGMITILLLLGMDSVALILVDLTLTVVFFVIDMFMALRVSKARIHFHYFDKPLFKESFLFSSFILLQALINQVNTNADKTILGIMLSPEAVAVYAVAMQIFVIYNSLSSAVSSVFLPKATRLVYSEATPAQLTDFVIRPGRFQFMILGIALAGFSILGQDFLHVWMGPEYKDAWLIALIIMVPSTIELIENVAVSIVLAKNKNGFRTTVMAGISLFNILFTVLLINWIGAIGAPIATAAAYVVGYIIVLNIYYQKAIGLQIGRMFKEIFKGTLPAVLLTAVLTVPLQLLVPQATWITFLFKAIYMVGIYIICMLLFGLNTSEKQMLKNAVARILKRQ